LIDKRLLNIKLPPGYSRATRSITERAHFKANEWRNILFYLAFGILKDILPNKFLKNLLKYIIFIRILCQEKISLEDCNDAILIFNDFHFEFESLYGQEEMTFNLHAHRHMPKQVWYFGGLDRRSGFPFENKFKHTRDLFHGTVNYDGQIAKNLDRKQQIIIELRELLIRTSNSEVKRLV
jgi:hypothetical protein